MLNCLVWLANLMSPSSLKNTKPIGPTFASLNSQKRNVMFWMRCASQGPKDSSDSLVRRLRFALTWWLSVVINHSADSVRKLAWCWTVHCALKTGSLYKQRQCLSFLSMLMIFESIKLIELMKSQRISCFSSELPWWNLQAPWQNQIHANVFFPKNLYWNKPQLPTSSAKLAAASSCPKLSAIS